MRAVLPLLIVWLGCTQTRAFPCSDSSQCSGGVCQPAGFCSAADSTCESGYRFDSSAGDVLAATCVPPEELAAELTAEHTAADEFTLRFAVPFAGEVDVEIFTDIDDPWTISEVVKTSETSAVVRLSGYPLPVEHRFAVVRLDDDGDEVERFDATIAGEDIGNRVLFVTRSQGDGNFLLWADRPANATAVDGPGAADEICQAEAEAAGLAGTYRAVIATGGADLSCQLLGETGTDCAGEAPPVGPGPWIDTSGFPVLAGVPALAAGEFSTVLRFHADQGPVVADVWSGVNQSGQPTGSCGDWTRSDSDAGLGQAWRDVQSRLPLRLAGNSLGCGGEKSLVCAQMDPGGLPIGDAHRVGGYPVFMTSTPVLGLIDGGTVPGVISANSLCQDLAEAADIDQAEKYFFLAYLSEDGEDAPCNVLGGSGSFAGGCGLGGIPELGPYVRVDGAMVAESFTDLVNGTFVHPLSLDENGSRAGNGLVFTGTDLGGAGNGNDCDDWTYGDGVDFFGQGGSGATLSDPIEGSSSTFCSLERRIYCIARDR
ncbi:MAG: hypothetical protein KJO07_11635 [Deltaproteobacteria bacterium]|nr:hypothetical protein [Deltaproteobacteria bacterium]